MVSGFERAKAEAWAYLDAITTAKDNARQLQDESNSNGNNSNSKVNGNDEIRGSFASL